MSARLRAFRTAAGLSQVELAARAGVSRQLIGAAERGRNVPRVDAAIAIAGALGVDVTELFALDAPAVDVVTGRAPDDGTVVRAGRVADRVVTAPAGIDGDGWQTADAVIDRGRAEIFGSLAPGLVVAGCEPGLAVLETILREGGMGALAAASSSRAAIAALDAGRVHAAVVHGPVGTVSSRVADRNIDRYRVARWRVGLAGTDDADADWWQRALAGEVAVIQREEGAGVQTAFENATGGGIPGPRVTTHLAAARGAAASGLAAVTIEPAALAVRARFHPLEVHEAELWVDRRWTDERPISAAVDVLVSERFLKRLDAVGGYDLAGCGSRVA